MNDLEEISIKEDKIFLLIKNNILKMKINYDFFIINNKIKDLKKYKIYIFYFKKNIMMNIDILLYRLIMIQHLH